MDRRAFLNAEPLLVGSGLAASLFTASDLDAADDQPSAALVHYRRRAMGTVFEVVLPLGTPRASEAACAALDLIDHLESVMSVHRDDSEASRVNRAAFPDGLPISDALFEVLAWADRLTRETRGAFDVASGALIKAWGFLRGPRRVPEPAERAEALQQSGMRFVALDPEHRTVRFLRSGVEINLGSIGKGYALDRAAALLREQFGIGSALLHGGHSSVYAIGSLPGSERGWPVGVTHPEDRRVRLGILWLKDRGLGVSAKTFQHLEWKGRKLGHILDPRTGWTAEGAAHVSVLAPTAAEADALATALFVLGEAEARRYLASRPDLQAIILSEAQREELARPR